MSVWDSCNTDCQVVIPVGAKGDPGASMGGVVVVSSGTATLGASDSGSTVYLSRAAGSTITLPEAPDVGTYFDFEVQTAASTGNYVINTSGSDVYDGYLFAMKASTAAERFTASATLTDVRITMNGTTQGGLVGSKFRLVYSNATTNTWFVSGQVYGSGVLVTSFS